MFELSQITVEVLTGLHIRASNLALRAEWDFVVDRGRVFVLDLDVLYERLWRGGAEIPRPADLLRGRDPQPFARYVLELSGGQAPAELWPVIRNPADGGPLIPGSSLKGVIRTALAWELYRGPLSHYPGGSRPQHADDGLERQHFGGEPHYDILRALRISDLQPAGACPQWAAPVELYSVGAGGRLQPAPGRSLGVIEIVGAGAVFTGTVSLDLDLLGRAAELRFKPEAVEALRRWPDVLGHFGRSLLGRQVRFLRERGLSRTADLLAGLGSRPGVIACLGWGTGWLGKTVGLKLSPEEVAEVARRYGFHRWRSPHFPNLFPISRRLARLPQGPIPLGWISLKVEGSR